jgi:Fe-S oxidoreductase
LRHAAKLAAGMPLKRRIPEFAPETFRSWFKKRNAISTGEKGDVILWPDTFNNYFFPDTAQAATEVLEGAGFNVRVPDSHLCCGRPLYDYGFLDRAKQYLRRILRTLAPEIDAGMPVIVLEPSCASVFRDELPNLFPDDPLATKFTQQTFLLSEFLQRKAEHWKPARLARKAFVQGHCHHKSVLKFDDENSILQKLGLDYKVLAAGCCGMAGSFGFEADKYGVSVDIGERVLFPAVREAAPDTIIVADGFSCREQISQQTERHALHLAEVIRMAEQNPAQASDSYPEFAIRRRRKIVRRRARVRALTALAAIAAVAMLLGKLAKKL